MATPPVSNSPLVSQHHAALVGLSRKLTLALRSPQLVGLDKSSPRYAAAFAALVGEFGSASVSLNSDYYEDAREDAAIPGAFRVPPVEPLPRERIDVALTEAIDTNDIALAQSQTEGAADLLVTSIGKDALIAAIMGDGKAVKWARVTSPAACAFCRMLATRGAVYRTDQTASFVAHPKCHCTIEAVFHPESYEPTAATRADAALYEAANENVRAGDQPNARLNAFRRAVAAERRGETPTFTTPRPTVAMPAAARLAKLQDILDGFGT